MIDSHCHLNFETISKNLDQIIKNAKINQISSILSINTDPNNFIQHYELINKYKSIFISYGLHPQNVNKKNILSCSNIIDNCSNDLVIGIGETGLDFYKSNDNRKEQFKAFENHIEASYETNLPLIIHQRNSEKEIIDTINNFQKNKPLKLVFHCFTGSKKLKNFCIDNNFFISISGIITFKNAGDLREIILDFPKNFILLETDSPFLAPVPYRGKINEPAYVKYIAQYLSDYFKISLEELSNITDNNFYNLFSKAIRYKEIHKC